MIVSPSLFIVGVVDDRVELGQRRRGGWHWKAEKANAKVIVNVNARTPPTTTTNRIRRRQRHQYANVANDRVEWGERRRNDDG